MTTETLYRSVLIETAEQAEALPKGTIATSTDEYAAEKDGGLWFGDSGPWGSPDMVGWTALVPIEAEEEWRVRDPSGAKYPVSDQTTALDWIADTNEGQPQTRLVTPWEEA